MNEPEEFAKNFARLTPRQREVLSHIMEGKSNQEIVEHDRISPGTVRKYVQNICDILQVPGEKGHSRKLALVTLVRRYKPDFLKEPQQDLETLEEDGNSYEFDLDFVGREGAIAHLDQLRQEGKTCVLIQGAGGVGKTVLAERYLAAQFPGRLVRFDVAKEKQAVGSASGLLESKLKELGEEPGREFAVSCDRLRSKLKAEAYGVLVDNLEPALDGHGRLISEHREYVELLRVLSDASLKSFTLITSREQLSENLSIELYRLDYLKVKAWGTYFKQKDLNVDAAVLAEMHGTYRGNALAMRVLRGRIVEDYQGNIERYWAEHQTPDGLVVEQAMENLITQQFERLQQVNLNAYNLLCRMGCFRFQDVPTVPREGLFCLLWDIPQNKAQKAIDTLRDLALVDRVDGEYRLHPLIKEQAIERLRNSEDWERANRTAAKFWKNIVQIIKTLEDFNRAFEDYYHYISISDYENALDAILKRKQSIWKEYYYINSEIKCDERLCTVARRFGLHTLFIDAINKLIEKVTQPTAKRIIVLLNLAENLWARGEVREAIEIYQNCYQSMLVLNLNEVTENNNQLLELIFIFSQGVCFFELGQTEVALDHLITVYQKAKQAEIFFYVIESSFVLAACYAKSKIFEKSNYFINEDYLYYCKYGDQLSSWAIVHRHFFLGEAYYFMDSFEKSEVHYKKAMDEAENMTFFQVIGKSYSGLAKLKRSHGDYISALSNHRQAIQTLNTIDAKCDLAEAYYQIALTYKAMGDTPNSQDYFNQSIALWQKINAPKQIERIQKSMNTPPQ
ncbi:LuxR C-terminal-related transcriptional regulator [Spirulina sp. CCNP1310]|uniref:LuxR C-terminal-related transcriptional regulator n=1 Tax=Spirulina sp. CCNP1310 TaxID=3110249 RepID=UPI002B213B8F|nr:LuxR C-terminal-related transcriptional regulator [Spirulina sp. CCNP1310]MEA5418716.1 LuxR C-terminal-related transcriptional regulator [Spirulina sp. CCNP1310]